MLEIRQATSALDPSARQQVLQIDPHFFLLLRGEQGTDQILLVCINISDQPIHLDLDLRSLDLEKYSQWQDLFSGMIFPKFRDVLHLEIAPYQYLWLAPRA